MPSEKKQVSLLKSKDYKINGNLLRAFYDKQGKLVFVLDSTIDEIKPNVLLVMASRGDRKWDDVLANDYNMDLELVRPKKDNKYQKLDIEYDGLVVYDNLIRAYNDGGDIKRALRELKDFRTASAHRSATERLAMASAVAENARETIERTGDTIIELQAKIKAVRAKIAGLRRNVGKEPTKQSAAKILRAEAQLDALTGKLERAKKRLDNANKRLLVAEDDIAAAQAVLDLISGDDITDKKFKTVAPVAVKKSVRRRDVDEEYEDQEIEPTDEIQDDDVFVPEDDDYNQDETDDDVVPDDDSDELDDDVNTDNDVKPLFDKDPQIMDEKIAFKPISFDENVAGDDDAEQTDLSVEYEDETPEHMDDEKQESDDVDDDQSRPGADKPAMSFEPPKPNMDAVSVPQESENNDDVELDDIFAALDDDADDDDNADTSETSDDEQQEKVDVPAKSEQSEQLEQLEQPEKSEKSDLNVVPILEGETVEKEIVAAPDDNKMDVTPVIEAPASETIDVVAPGANTGSENLVRPVSPVAANTPIANVPAAPEQHRKPNVLYYVLLLVLIGLSIFTLWLYQRSNVTGEVLPTLVPEETDVVQSEISDATPALAQDVQEASVAEDTEDPFVASGEEAEKPNASTVEKVAEESLNKIAEAADIPMETEDAPEEVEEETDEEPATEPVVNKPEYNVTQEKVFTSDEPDITGGSLCDGDVSPDANGCCPGETYSKVDGQNVCCPDDGGDCFPPMF